MNRAFFNHLSLKAKGAMGRVRSSLSDLKTLSLQPGGRPRGRVLLSYLNPSVFKLSPEAPEFYWHVNVWECREMARTFVDMGYIVDAISWRNRVFTPKVAYSVFVDVRFNMERLAGLVGPSCVKILLCDSAHVLFRNAAESARLLALQQRRGVTLSPRLLENPNLGIENADCAMVVGGAPATMKTFLYAGKPLYPLPISTPFLRDWEAGKDFEVCRKNFLWLGSAGLVLKGLDLALEAFAAMPDLHLTVCGPIQQTQDFERAFAKELYRTPNIHTVGWVDIGSRQFLDIARNCLALVYPSATEAVSGGAVACMHSGLIPIAGADTGVHTGDFGCTLESCSIQEIKDTVRYFSRLPAQELRARARSAWEYAQANYTREAFSAGFRRTIGTILERHCLEARVRELQEAESTV
jgi:glycosyltransferase involved in cell wall biosynthesis